MQDGFIPAMHGWNEPRETLHTTESLHYMQSMYNAGAADDMDSDWFDSDELPNHVTIIDGEEFFERYVF